MSGPGRKAQDSITAEYLLNLPSAVVAEDDNLVRYVQRILQNLIATKRSDFPKRIRSINQREGRPVGILSLCSGAAGIERQLIGQAKCPVQITLFDLNEKLRREAAATLSSIAETSGFLGDVNELSAEQFGNKTFDIVMFVSGLHHVVEIERVCHSVIELLVANGEFWIIGEPIGRNGNRLWPEALEVAKHFFRRYQSVTDEMPIPSESMLRSPKPTSPRPVLKEFVARKSSRCYCDISIL